MSNPKSLPSLLLIMVALLFGCGRPAKELNENTTSAHSLSLQVGDGKYVRVDMKESVVTWRGSSVQGAHTGYVYVSKGELILENGKFTRGTVEVDMSTIEDHDHRSDNNLIKHLKDPDFFDVKKFPFSSIDITTVTSIHDENEEITGNLTIKGITHMVRFPAQIEIKDGIVRANGKLVIDRTRWDVRYNSGKFYDNLADKTISDSIEFHIQIVARK